MVLFKIFNKNISCIAGDGFIKLMDQRQLDQQ